MRILLDSHSLAWYLTANTRCSQAARAAIEAPGASVHVSAVSAWEIATKVRNGRWPEAAHIADQLEPILERNEFIGLAVTLEHGRVAGFLPGAHRDPFDRMLAAQALVEGLVLVTADPAFRHFDVQVLW